MTDEVRDGGMNLLGKVDVWDNLIRIKSESVAQELMGMILKEFSFILVAASFNLS